MQWVPGASYVHTAMVTIWPKRLQGLATLSVRSVLRPLEKAVASQRPRRCAVQSQVDAAGTAWDNALSQANAVVSKL